MRIRDWSSDVCSSDLKDLADIPDNVKRKLEIVPVSDCDEVLARALVKELTPIEWTESEDDVQTTRTPQGDGEQPGVLTHYAGARKQIGRASCRERVCKYV